MIYGQNEIPAAHYERRGRMIIETRCDAYGERKVTRILSTNLNDYLKNKYNV